MYYRVEYYNKFADKWEPYVAITFNSRPRKYQFEGQAENAMAHLKRMHPRDTFRVSKVEE